MKCYKAVEIVAVDRREDIEKFPGRIEESVSDRLSQINRLWQRLIEP
ncbi:MAG: hypothetical protein AB4372_14660 [Xenococcus sp. (in: cyanobacteria)]